MPLILALDQGTTSSRALVFDAAGKIRGQAQHEFAQIYPQGGWVEHDPEELWRSQLAAAQQALRSAGVAASDLTALAIANQRETTLLWDRRTGAPVSNAIVWQDRRTAPLCDQLRRDGLLPVIQAKTGLVLDPYFSASKLRWLLDHLPGPQARRAAERGELAFGTVDSWLIWKLTGGTVHATDASNASRTMLFNIHSLQWDDELLRIFQIPRAVLPVVYPSSGVCGVCDPRVLGAEVPIAGIAGDQQAALFGQACFSPGLAKNTYGTGCFMLMHVGDAPATSKHNLLSTVAWRVGTRTQYALEGSVFIGGAVVQWLRDGLGLIRSAADIEALAATVPDAGGVHIVPAFAGLGAPHWDPYARGTITGITRGTTSAHFARAALDAIAHQVADALDAMRADAGTPLHELRADGGAARNNLLLQLQADLLRLPVVRPQITETTALGAAYLAGLAVGVWGHTADIAAHWRIDRTFEPRLSADEVHHRRARWAQALARARDWEPHDTDSKAQALPGPGPVPPRTNPGP
jgi:glycerol kinase